MDKEALAHQWQTGCRSAAQEAWSELAHECRPGGELPRAGGFALLEAGSRCPPGRALASRAECEDAVSALGLRVVTHDVRAPEGCSLGPSEEGFSRLKTFASEPGVQERRDTVALCRAGAGGGA